MARWSAGEISADGAVIANDRDVAALLVGQEGLGAVIKRTSSRRRTDWAVNPSGMTSSQLLVVGRASDFQLLVVSVGGAVTSDN